MLLAFPFQHDQNIAWVLHVSEYFRFFATVLFTGCIMLIESYFPVFEIGNFMPYIICHHIYLNFNSVPYSYGFSESPRFFKWSPVSIVQCRCESTTIKKQKA